jgi:hypothetical protein
MQYLQAFEGALRSPGGGCKRSFSGRIFEVTGRSLREGGEDKRFCPEEDK